MIVDTSAVVAILPGSGTKARLTLWRLFRVCAGAESGEPPLFVGGDFTHTVVTSASPPG